jgi:hypothetical protein
MRRGLSRERMRCVVSVIATLVGPRRVTVFFDCDAAAAHPADQPDLERAFEASLTTTADDDIAPDAVPATDYVTRAELAEIVPTLQALAGVEGSARVRSALHRLADRYAAPAAS